MKKILPLILIALFFTNSAFIYNKQQKISVFLIGDSTMADKKVGKSPETGWGQVLPQFFTDEVIVKNHAVNGRSTKSFISEGRWQKVLDEIKTGDYVFIQFGHNDQKYKDSSRFTNPYTGYRQNLTKFVNETLEKGAVPVLLSSVIRRKFNEFGTLTDTHGAYPEVVRTVAKELNVTLIDLQILSEQLVVSLGPEKSKNIFLWVEKGHKNYPEGKQDDTHFNKKGAVKVAKMVIDELQKSNLTVKEFIK